MLPAVNSNLGAEERDLPFLELLTHFSRRDFSLLLNGDLLNGDDQRVLKECEYRAVDLVFPNLCGFID